MAPKLWPKLSIRKVILSKSRPDRITSHRLFPTADLVVPESEVEQYEKYRLPITPISDTYEGLGQVRNWVLRHFDDEIIVMIDDDVTEMRTLTHRRNIKRCRNSVIIDQTIDATAMCAKDLGVQWFGFNQTWDPRKFHADKPFSINSWVGGVVGVIGRKYAFDELNKLKVDIDYTLKNLMYERIVFVENRHSFVQVRDLNVGGNSIFRTQEQLDFEKKRLKERWKSHIHFRLSKTTVRTTINVPRRQSGIRL